MAMQAAAMNNQSNIELPSLKTLGLIPRHIEALVSIMGLELLPKKRDLTLRPILKPHTMSNRVAQRKALTKYSLPSLITLGIKPDEMRDPNLGYPVHSRPTPTKSIKPRSPKMLLLDSSIGIFHGMSEYKSSSLSKSETVVETKTKTTLSKPLSPWDLLSYSRMGIFHDMVESQGSSMSATPAGMEPEKTSFKPRCPEKLLLDSSVGILHDMLEPRTSSLFFDHAAPEANTSPQQPVPMPGTSHGMQEYRLFHTPPRPSSALEFQDPRSLLERARVVMAVKTSTGASLTLPSVMEARFLAIDDEGREIEASVANTEKQSNQIFDCLLGRMRKRFMVDDDSRREKHLEAGWQNTTADDLRGNPLFLDGDEDLCWEDFQVEMYRRFYFSSLLAPVNKR